MQVKNNLSTLSSGLHGALRGDQLHRNPSVKQKPARRAAQTDRQHGSNTPLRCPIAKQTVSSQNRTRLSKLGYASQQANRSLVSWWRQPLLGPLLVTAAVISGSSWRLYATSTSQQATSLPTTPDVTLDVFRSDATVRILTIAPAAAASPLKLAPWDEVLQHMRNKLFWTDQAFDLVLLDSSCLTDGSTVLQGRMQQADIIVPIAIRGGEAVAALNKLSSALGEKVLLPLDCDAAVRPVLPGAPASLPGLLQAVDQVLPWMTPSKKASKVLDTVHELYARHNGENLLYAFLVLINAYITPVPQVANSIEGTSLGAVACMLTNCAQPLIACVRDDSCSTALNCLDACKFNDQVCSYRCIASYESPLLQQFSLCILQKHNCLGLDAQPPALPDPVPLAQFRGKPMTHELAEDLFVGWFADKPFSWRVAAGVNPAYDYFPCQFQLFYRAKKGKSTFWYDPIFKVRTLDGRTVWRERHYRVRRAQVPGSFFLSVLDNGVTSKEFWRILDCDEDLQWCLFYYSGAASAAGVSYSGAILGTIDGEYPAPAIMESRVAAALERAGMKLWELSTVDNSQCSEAPLAPIAEPATKQLLTL